MNIIPVIDIKDGLVVSAKQGKRDTYAPLTSPLCSSSHLKTVVVALLTIYPFHIIYIADLNAITGTGNNQSLINTLINNNTKIEFWVDNGQIAQKMYLNTYNYRPIIGSESQTNISNTEYISGFLNHTILSLDFFPNTGYSGPAALLENTQLWPQKIIIMTLDRVGKNTGPDFEKLACFCKEHPDKTFIAAGGVRDKEDLINLKKIGVNHALVSSALHSGKIDRKIIDALSYL